MLTIITKKKIQNVIFSRPMKMIVYRLFPSTCGELDGWRKTYTQDCIKPRIKQKLKIVKERALKLCWSFRTCGIGKRWLGTSKSFRSAAIYAHNVIHQNLKCWFFFLSWRRKKIRLLTYRRDKLKVNLDQPHCCNARNRMNHLGRQEVDLFRDFSQRQL